MKEVNLVMHFKEYGIMACGTVRSNQKGLPTGMKANRDLQKGAFDYRITDQSIGFYRWMDNKAVHLISNFHGSDVLSGNRTKKRWFQRRISLS